MEKYINNIIDASTGGEIALGVDKVIRKDDMYIKYMEQSLVEHEKLIKGLEQSKIDILNEYIDCILNANERACNIAYLAGVKDTVKFIDKVKSVDSKES